MQKHSQPNSFCDQLVDLHCAMNRLSFPTWILCAIYLILLLEIIPSCCTFSGLISEVNEETRISNIPRPYYYFGDLLPEPTGSDPHVEESDEATTSAGNSIDEAPPPAVEVLEPKLTHFFSGASTSVHHQQVASPSQDQTRDCSSSTSQVSTFSKATHQSYINPQIDKNRSLINDKLDGSFNVLMKEIRKGRAYELSGLGEEISRLPHPSQLYPLPSKFSYRIQAFSADKFKLPVGSGNSKKDLHYMPIVFCHDNNEKNQRVSLIRICNKFESLIYPREIKQSLDTLIRSVYNFHQALIIRLGFTEHQEYLQIRLFAWLQVETFNPDYGLPVLGKLIGQEDKIPLFGIVQQILIDYLSTLGKTDYVYHVSISLIRIWYLATHPKIWRKTWKDDSRYFDSWMVSDVAQLLSYLLT